MVEPLVKLGRRGKIEKVTDVKQRRLTLRRSGQRELNHPLPNTSLHYVVYQSHLK